ncbi:MAG TPA: T9SS type A sorting domain-containing protein [Flavisolibacter sp.]|nr:T9SS type A sorting domain-containing protein [Flavisolibacter sp.]
MNTFRQRSAGNRTGWLSLFAGAGKGLLALLLFSFSFAARANDNPFFASKDYFHWADKTSTWDNGNLSKNKSAYKEGDVVPHSYVPENLTNGQSYSILLKYDYLLSTKNAGGFVALVWDPTLFSVTPTGQMGEGSLSNGNKSLPSIGSYYATNLSITNVVAKPDETSGNTTLKVWEITFTYTGINGSDAALYFGLRLAQVGEVATNGAAAWSGASLQTYLDPSSDPGTRSLQIDPGAIQSACPNPPTVDAGTYGPLCANGDAINLDQGTPAGGTWSGTGVSGDQTNGYTFDPSVGTQILTYTYTDGNGCSNSDETTITVNNPPNVSVGTYGPLCSNGDDIALGGIPNGGTWTGTGVSGSQATGYTFDPSAGTQTLTYSYTDPNTGCTASATVIITVNEPPVVTAGTYGPLCANASPINLVGSPAGGIWSGTGVSGDQTNGYTFDPSVGTQTLTYTYTAGGCSNSDQATVVVNPVATVDAGMPQTICSNGTATLAGSFGGSATSATWSSAGDGKFDDATKLNAVYTPGAQDIANGSVVLTLTTNDPDGPCDAATATVTITIEKAPTADFTYSQSCTGGIAKISLTGTVTNSVSQTWTTDGDGTFDDASKLNAVYTPGQLDRGKGSVNITLTANVAEGSACAPASKTYTVAVTPCGPYYTYTQGYYGNSGGMACTPTGSKTTLQLIQQSLDNMSGAPNDQAGTLYLGKAGASFSMTYADASKLILIMPGGGPANKLAGNYSLTSTATYPPLKNGKINNVLLSQTITLALNVAIPGNDLGGLILQDGYLTTITRSSSSCTAPAATCPNGIVSSKKITLNPALMALLNGKTVTDLLNLASAALGGTLPAGVSYSDISNAVDVINNLFDAGRYSLGYFDCAKTCSTLTQPCTVMIVSNRQSSDAAEVETVAGKLAVSAYPNPFTDRVRFTIQSPKAGRATLEVYNMLGQKLAVPFEGQLNAGETRNVDYTAPVNHRSSLIYLLRMNGEQISGKLMGTKQ